MVAVPESIEIRDTDSSAGLGKYQIFAPLFGAGDSLALLRSTQPFIDTSSAGYDCNIRGKTTDVYWQMKLFNPM